MRVLITNHALALIGGAQAYTYDLAAWLLEHGHSAAVYGPDHGAAAEQIARLGIPVTDDLETVADAPDIIHGNSPIETMAALLRFPGTPAIFVCHGARGIEGLPPRFPRIHRYVAVDDTCAGRLTSDGIAPEKIAVLLNAVDLRRFRQRAPLPERPRRAVIFSNNASEATHVPAIREACRRAGVECDVVGAVAGNARGDPESVLAGYDIAFAKARAALEAMASGLAVIVCDREGVAGIARSADVPRLRRLNFGFRTMEKPVSVDVIASELAAYDPLDARRVSDLIRETASADDLFRSLLALYEEAIAAKRPAEWDEESRAAAAFIAHMHDATRRDQSRLTLALQAVDRLLRLPLVGAAATRVARWVVGPGRKN
jgi:glycosyltransferase involved in cell wall biosynthesis